jgi:molecular chaperone DnaJ
MTFYLTLGIRPGATAGEIRRAFRRLARRHHPELNPGDDEAANRFARIVEAYETLVDPARRERYDAGERPAATPTAAAVPGGQSFAFEGFDFTTHVEGAAASTFGDLFADVVRAAAESVTGGTAGSDLHAELRVPLDATIHGLLTHVTLTRRAPCGVCGGSGRVQAVGTPCPDCRGAGAIRSARGHMLFMKACARCEGTGATRFADCRACAAEGVVIRSETVPIKVPAGAGDGEVLRFPQQGNAGRRGAPAGDLRVTVRIEPHPLFRREGDDLHLDVPLAIHEAAFGAKIEVPSPTGPCRVRIPPGTQSGQRFRLRERGVPSARAGRPGDLIVTVRLVLPPLDDERSRALVRDLASAYSDDVRKTLRM